MERAGQLLNTACLAVTLVGLLIQDWNRTHVYNSRWPPHARFHAITGIVMNFGFALIGLWLLWAPTAEVATHTLVAALVPVVAWGSFFVAAVVPGSGIEDTPGEVTRVAGVPANILGATTFCALSVLGYLLCALSRSG